jgi:hypothetical protein
MVHSLELVFDADTETALRHIWDGLRNAGLPAQPPAARPHVTATVAQRIDGQCDRTLAALAGRFPVRCRIGAPLLFGSVLARLVVPSVELLDLQAEVYRLSAPWLQPGPLPHCTPGDWTPHVTLGRRIPPDRLAEALRTAGRPTELIGGFIGLRHWDGNARTEFPIC